MKTNYQLLLISALLLLITAVIRYLVNLKLLAGFFVLPALEITGHPTSGKFAYIIWRGPITVPMRYPQYFAGS